MRPRALASIGSKQISGYTGKLGEKFANAVGIRCHGKSQPVPRRNFEKGLVLHIFGFVGVASNKIEEHICGDGWSTSEEAFAKSE